MPRSLASESGCDAGRVEPRADAREVGRRPEVLEASGESPAASAAFECVFDVSRRAQVGLDGRGALRALDPREIARRRRRQPRRQVGREQPRAEQEHDARRRGAARGRAGARARSPTRARWPSSTSTNSGSVAPAAYAIVISTRLPGDVMLRGECGHGREDRPGARRPDDRERGAEHEARTRTRRPPGACPPRASRAAGTAGRPTRRATARAASVPTKASSTTAIVCSRSCGRPSAASTREAASVNATNASARPSATPSGRRRPPSPRVASTTGTIGSTQGERNVARPGDHGREDQRDAHGAILGAARPRLRRCSTNVNHPLNHRWRGVVKAPVGR